MATVIEEAIIRILPSFKEFKEELELGLKRATEGKNAEVKIKLNVDSSHLRTSVKDALANIGGTSSTSVKIKGEFDHAQMKRDFTTALSRATESAASTAAAARVRIDVNGGYLKASLQTGIREAVRSVNATTGDSVHVKVEPIIDRRKLDTQLAELSKKTVVIKVRYETSNAPVTAPRALGGGGGGGGRDGGGGRRVGGSPSGQSSTTLAEFINALPGIGGIGPNAARAIVSGIAAGAPLIAATLSAAVALGIGATGIAAGIAVAAKDDKVRNSASLLGGSIMGTLTGAAQPFRDELLSVMPQIGKDVEKLQPKLYGIFQALAPSISSIETGLSGALENALSPQAAKNSAQVIDTIAAKLPAMGAAVGQFLVAVTDPKSAKFFTTLIDFVDATIVAIGRLVSWLGKVNQAFSNAGVFTVIGAIFKTLVNTIGTVGSLLGPGMTATVVALGAAFVLFGNKVKAVISTVVLGWQEAAAAVGVYRAEVAAAGVSGAGSSALAYSRAGAGSPGLARIGGGFAKLAPFALPAIGALAGGAISGDSAPGSTRNTVGTILSGASAGAFAGGLIGSAFPGAGTAIGAGAGAVIGGLIAAIAANTEALKSNSTNVQKAADAYASGGTSRALNTINNGSDQGLKNLAKFGPKEGFTVSDALDAVNSGDVNKLKGYQAVAKRDSRGSSFGDVLKNAGRILIGKDPVKSPNPKIASGDASKIAAALPGLITAAQANKEALDRNAQSYTTTPPWTGTVFEKFQQLITGTTPSGISNPFTTSTGLNVAPEVQTINAATEAYRNYTVAQRGADDARYQQQQTIQQTAVANEAALHGMLAAEHGLAQAHFGTEMAQRSLTEARKEAIANLTELHRQVRDLGDNEESLKIKLVEANLAEQQTRGLDPDSLVRRKAILEKHAATNALADFQADRPVLLDKAKVADQRGVEGSTAVKQATNALSEAHLNENEQIRNVKLSRDAYNNTLEASRRANKLAKRAVDDATYAEGQQAAQLGLVEGALGLTTDAVKKLYDHSLLLNRTFAIDINDGGTALVAKNAIGDLYEGLVQLASAYGITIPDWNSTFQIAPVAPGPSPTAGAPGRRGRAAFAVGGTVMGWSPHERADNIPAWLTADEFVVNQASARKHRPLLEAINADRHYADGGLVLPLNAPVDKWSAPIKANLKSLLATSGLSADGNSNIGQVQNWLRNGADPLPYVWGAVGPNAFDCSGLVGEVWARLTGNPSNRRYFSTGDERQFLTQHGFKDGTGTFTVGFSGEHTMGVLGGMPFEAANSRDGILTGAHTSRVTSFPNVMYLPQLGDQFIGSSGGQPPDPSRVSVGGVFGAFMRKILADAKKLADMRGSGGDSGRADAADANVAQIAFNTARQMGVDNKSLLALFEAGIVESGMRNLNYGDRDSLGFLQQRASWGSVESRENVAESARRFLSRAIGKSGNAATAGRLAQSVQVSAFPDRYDGQRGAAIALLRRLDPSLQFGTYDSGGWLNDFAFNRSGQPEAVLNPQESRAYVQHAQAVSQGGDMRLDDWTIARLAQAMSTRPIPVHLDGRQVADAVYPHLERRF